MPQQVLHKNRVKFPKDFFAFVLSTNMPAVTSDAIFVRSAILGFHSRDETPGHVGVQNNRKWFHKFCIIIESNSQNTFYCIVLYINMAAVTSDKVPQ